MAGSDPPTQPMHESLSALRSLQEIDRQIFQAEAELRRLPAELARRTEDLAEQARRLAEVRGRVQELRRDAKEIEDYTTGLRQRQRKLERESASQKVDAALLASFEVEIRNLKRNISQAEDDALRKIGQGDDLTSEADVVAQRLAEEKETFEEFKRNVEREIAAAQARRAELLDQRAQCSADGIEPAQLELYRRLLEQREGEALAELSGGHCQACFVQIPKNLGVRLMRGELVQCPSCDRILYTVY